MFTPCADDLWLLPQIKIQSSLKMSHVLMNFVLAHWFSFHVTMPRRPLCFETGNINSMVFFIDFFTAWIATTIEAIFSPPSSSFHACILSRRVFSHEWTPSTTSLPPPFTTGLPLHYDSCVGEPVGSLVGSFFSRRMMNDAIHFSLD